MKSRIAYPSPISCKRRFYRTYVLRKLIRINTYRRFS
jgi:hypothetical protein